MTNPVKYDLAEYNNCLGVEFVKPLTLEMLKRNQHVTEIAINPPRALQPLLRMSAVQGMKRLDVSRMRVCWFGLTLDIVQTLEFIPENHVLVTFSDTPVESLIARQEAFGE